MQHTQITKEYPLHHFSVLEQLALIFLRVVQKSKNVTSDKMLCPLYCALLWLKGATSKSKTRTWYCNTTMLFKWHNRSLSSIYESVNLAVDILSAEHIIRSLICELVSIIRKTNGD